MDKYKFVNGKTTLIVWGLYFLVSILVKTNGLGGILIDAIYGGLNIVAIIFTVVWLAQKASHSKTKS